MKSVKTTASYDRRRKLLAATVLRAQISQICHRHHWRRQMPRRGATWTRGRGWAIWKAMKVLIDSLDGDPQDAAFTSHVIDKILADHLENT
jgi:rhamnogalacturonyl hydrolase YesR